MTVNATIDKHVMTIAFDRLERKNAITAAMYEKMADALARAEAEADATVRAVLLTGHTQIFTAGNDLEDFMQRPPAGEDAPVFQFLRSLARFQKPLVAAVSGAAVGIGTTMLLHCDLVYASDTARLSLPFTQLGLCPEAASSLLLPQLIGYPRAAEKLLLGESFAADEALALGLVNKVLPVGELMPFVHAQLQKLVALPADSLRTTKRLLKAGQQAAVAQRMGEEGAEFGRLLRGPEAREAFSAFFEKRKPDFMKLA